MECICGCGRDFSPEGSIYTFHENDRLRKELKEDFAYKEGWDDAYSANAKLVCKLEGKNLKIYGEEAVRAAFQRRYESLQKEYDADKVEEIMLDNLRTLEKDL